MKTRPNILFIMSDQQRPDSLGCYGNCFVDSPNIDALAAGGMVFDESAKDSGLLRMIVMPAGASGPLPIVMLIVPTRVPTASSRAVMPAISLVTFVNYVKPRGCPSRRLAHSGRA